MGVAGLLSECLSRQAESCEFVDLVQIAENRGGIELLVDFSCFQYSLIEKMFNSLSRHTGNRLIGILGGEYAHFDKYIKKFINDLRAVGITLVIFMDGTKGCSSTTIAQKMETWITRHKKNQNIIKQIIRLCNGSDEFKNVSTEILPILMEIQINNTLKDCACEIIRCVSGEGDLIIAKSFLTRPKAYAILSNDSDFAIMKDCHFIPEDLFDIGDDLKRGQELLTVKPQSLKVGIVSTERVMAMLKLTDHDMLVEVGIVCGNDFTKPHDMYELRKRIDVMRPMRCRNVAKWVQRYIRVENHPVIARRLRDDVKFRQAVESSRQFYKLTLPEDELIPKGPISKLLETEVEAGRLEPYALSIHQNFYWHRNIIEVIGQGAPCAERALVTLRRYVYGIILDEKEDTVTEYGRSPHEELEVTQISCIRESWIERFDDLHQQTQTQKLLIFSRIMKHMEPEFEVDFIDKYGCRTGFILCCLRYFLKLNDGAHLCLSINDFLPLLAMVFSDVDQRWYQSLSIRPSADCLTISSWFQNVYRYAYDFIGKSLYISEQFPEPREIFSGSVFTAFYMVTCHAEADNIARGLKADDMPGRVHDEMHNILSDDTKTGQYHDVMDNIFTPSQIQTCLRQ